MLKTPKTILPRTEPASDQTIAVDGSSQGGEPYVPVRKDELIAMLVRNGKLDEGSARRFRKLCRLIETIFHQDFHLRQEHLKTLYAPFDPDTETRPIQSGGRPSRNDTLGQFLDGLTDVLIAANYRPLTAAELEDALSGASYWGLDLQINRKIFDRLVIFVRGDTTTTRARRDAGTLFRSREVSLDVYERLVLAMKLSPNAGLEASVDTESIYLKMFREIPQLDVEMLLPGTRARMKWFDSAKIGLPSASGVFTIFKLIWFPVVVGLLFWFSVAMAAICYGVGSFLGYVRTKERYALSMSRSLYYQNMDNNVGVFCRVIDEAQDEETKEAILAYYFLWQQPTESWTPERLGGEIENLVREQTGDHCRFQTREAITKLERLGLLTRDSDRLQALELDVATARLTEKLRDYVIDLNNA